MGQVTGFEDGATVAVAPELGEAVKVYQFAIACKSRTSALYSVKKKRSKSRPRRFLPGSEPRYRDLTT